MAWGEACPAAEEEENQEGGVRGCLCFQVVFFYFFEKIGAAMVEGRSWRKK